MRQLSLAVVGGNHPNSDGTNRRSEILFCDPGEVLTFIPEPKNPHDEHAIAVYSARNFQIGYLASARAVFVGKLMREGHDIRAIFQDVAQYGAIARVGIDCDPLLPAAQLQSDHVSDADGDADETDFFPDYLPPDD